MTTLTLKIPNISCVHCVHTIKTELGELVGVQSVAGNIETKEVVVAFEAPASQTQIEALLADISYPVEKATSATV